MEKIPLVLSPSQQSNNKCSVCASEASHMKLIFQELYNKFKLDDRFDVLLIPTLTGSDNDKLVQITTLSNNFVNKRKPAIHLSGHSDGGYKGTGASAFWYADGGLGEKLGKEIFKKVCDLTPWSDMQSYARPGLWELKETDASAALIEVSFHDKIIEAQWIHNNVKSIANCFYLGTYAALGLEPFVPKDDNLILVEHMMKDSLITDKQGWYEIMQGKRPVPLEFFKIICQRAVDKI